MSAIHLQAELDQAGRRIHTLEAELARLREMVLQANSLLRSTDKGSMAWHDEMDEWAHDFRVTFDETANVASSAEAK